MTRSDRLHHPRAHRPGHAGQHRATALRWDGTEFIDNWKTSASVGACYSVTATTTGGSSITALFQLS